MIGGFDLIYKGKEVGLGAATSYTTMLGCKNNRVDNLKKLARATAFRLAKEYQEKNRAPESSKKLDNKFTIKMPTKSERPRVLQKTIPNQTLARNRVPSHPEPEKKAGQMPSQEEQIVKRATNSRKHHEEE